MSVRKRTFFLGVFIFLIPFLGLPTFWKTFFIIFSGVTLVLISVKINFHKRILKNKIKKDDVQTEGISTVEPIISRGEDMEIKESVLQKTPKKRRSVTKSSTNKTV